jgi:hypothetical protein
MYKARPLRRKSATSRINDEIVPSIEKMKDRLDSLEGLIKSSTLTGEYIQGEIVETDGRVSSCLSCIEIDDCCLFVLLLDFYKSNKKEIQERCGIEYQLLDLCENIAVACGTYSRDKGV